MNDIAGIDKADLLIALHAAASPLGMGILHARGPMSREEATKMIAGTIERSWKAGVISFDYVHGCPLKVDIGGDELDPRLYDRDQGEGACARVVAELRTKTLLADDGAPLASTDDDRAIELDRTVE